MRRAVPMLGAVVLVLALAPAAYATTGTLFITSNTTLTVDHYGSVVIAADSVTFDCAGFAVIGPGELPDGIRMYNRFGVTVSDCHVRGFNMGSSWPPLQGTA